MPNKLVRVVVEGLFRGHLDSLYRNVDSAMTAQLTVFSLHPHGWSEEEAEARSRMLKGLLSEYLRLQPAVPKELAIRASNTLHFSALLQAFAAYLPFYFQVRQEYLEADYYTFKEIKDEYKNSEGDPHVKAALRQRRMQMLQRGAMDSVPEADFVVRNPIHVACAMKYDAETMQSPTLTCKGTELIAKQIIDLAQKHNVPIIDNPPVARALFRMVDLNQQIPPELYKAVAEILLFVYGLKAKQNGNN